MRSETIDKFLDECGVHMSNRIQYKGPLYAKVAGKYVPVEHDAQYYDRLEAENERLKCCGNCLSLDNCIETKDCNVDPAGRCDDWSARL